MVRWALAALLLGGCLDDAQDPEGEDSEAPGAGGELAGDGEAPFVCVGVDPGAEAHDEAPGPIRDLGGEGEGEGEAEPPPDPEPLQIGEAAPAWRLADFQPQSCGYEAVYGMEAFKGRATVVALLAAW